MVVPSRSSSAGAVRRYAIRALVALCIVAAPASSAHADPPTPVDYRSEVADLVPATDAFVARIVGGDSFIELAAAPGAVLAVAGYQGEPFLRFLADGSVDENRASPTYFVNRQRLGAPTPPGVTADSPPNWTRVATDGSYAWHDHRTHWMGTDDPPGHRRGDQILENSIPVVVDGTTTITIVVRSFWEPAPSPVPLAIGVVVGGALAAALVQCRRRRVLLLIGAATSAAAMAVGFAERASLPPETSPLATAWLLPAVALAATAASAVLGRRVGGLLHAGLVAVAGLNLTIWAWSRRGALTKAVLPTDLPWWIERSVTAAVLLAAPFLVVVALQPVVVAWRTGRPDPANHSAASTL